MDEFPPEPPELDRAAVEDLIDWLDRTAAWTEDHYRIAQAHGHELNDQDRDYLQLYKDASLLLREAYDSQYGFITDSQEPQ